VTTKAENKKKKKEKKSKGNMKNPIFSKIKSIICL